MTSGYRLLEVEWLKNMWRPDSFFKNAKSVTFQTMTVPNHYMWLYKDKTILYMVKLTLRLSCAMNFLIYPHDTQECKLQMESCEWECEFALEEGAIITCPSSFSVSHHRRSRLSMGPRAAACRRWEHWTATVGAGQQQNVWLYASVFHRQLYLSRGRLRLEAETGLLLVPHLRAHVSHRYYVGVFVERKRLLFSGYR